MKIIKILGLHTMLLLMIFLLNIPSKTYSQNCISDDESQPCCNDIISTDPRFDESGNPYAENEDRPEMINKFNWMNEVIYIYHPSGGYGPYGQTINVANPFHTYNYDYLSHINYFLQEPPFTSDMLDFYPEDGWELIHKNNGLKISETDTLETLDSRIGDL